MFNRKISIIGGSGFLGTRLCQKLESAQIDFEILDLVESESFPERSKIVDITDKKALSNALTGDVVVHLAAVHRDDVEETSAYYQCNVEGTRNIVKACDEKNISKIIFTSSVAVYGFAAPETDERGEIKPFNDYGKSKFMAEEVLRKWHAEADKEKSLIIIRPTVIFGEGNKGNVYNLLAQIKSGKFMMIGDGNNVKSMAYVGNVAEFLLRCVVSDDSFKLVNYIDKPDMNMNSLVSKARLQLLGKAGVGPRIPYILGLIIGYLADLIFAVLRVRLPVSAIRVKKFCSNTQFSSLEEKLLYQGSFVELGEALERTINNEFFLSSESSNTNRK